MTGWWSWLRDWRCLGSTWGHCCHCLEHEQALADILAEEELEDKWVQPGNSSVRKHCQSMDHCSREEAWSVWCLLSESLPHKTVWSRNQELCSQVWLDSAQPRCSRLDRSCCCCCWCSQAEVAEVCREGCSSSAGLHCTEAGLIVDLQDS